MALPLGVEIPSSRDEHRPPVVVASQLAGDPERRVLTVAEGDDVDLVAADGSNYPRDSVVLVTSCEVDAITN